METAFAKAKRQGRDQPLQGPGRDAAAQLRDTTMDPAQAQPRARDRARGRRARLKSTVDLVESLMGRKPELRFEFIQERAQFVKDLDV